MEYLQLLDGVKENACIFFLQKNSFLNNVWEVIFILIIFPQIKNESRLN